jgi:hypothetical protein
MVERRSARFISPLVALLFVALLSTDPVVAVDVDLLFLVADAGAVLEEPSILRIIL